MASAPPRASLRDFACHRALDPSQRMISITAVMRPLPGTRRMQLKFELFSKAVPNGTSTAVTGGDLGKWISPSDPTLGRQPGDVWILNHPVVGLAAPDLYRFRILFRWVGAHQHVLGTAVRLTRTCFQPELRPDLFVKSITVQPIPGNAQQDRYVAVIGDRGATGAGPFDVEMTQGEVVKHHTVGWLRPHHTTTVSFKGQACTADTAPTIIVDPENRIDDYNRTNNTLTATCPASSPGPTG